MSDASLVLIQTRYALLATLRTQVALGRALRRGQRLEAENRILRSEWATRIAQQLRLDALAVRDGPRRVEARVVGPEGRADRPRDPVQHHVRQQGVLGEASLDVAAAVAPRSEFLHDPGGEPDRRVGEAVGERLGLRALDPLVAGLLPLPSSGSRSAPTPGWSSAPSCRATTKLRKKSAPSRSSRRWRRPPALSRACPKLRPGAAGRCRTHA